MKLRFGVLAGLVLLGLAGPHGPRRRRLSDAADQDHRAVSRRRRPRPGRAPARPASAGRAGTDGRDREPQRRARQPRRPGSRAQRAGRLHPADGNQHHAGQQRRDAEKPALRSRQGFCADHPHHHDRDGAAGEAGLSGQGPRAIHGIRQNPSEHDRRLRLRRVADIESRNCRAAAACRSSRRRIAACRWRSPT